jgi:hypothetical protein
MNPALLLLLRMQTLAAIRRAFRGLRTVKGATFVIIGVAMFFVWLAPVVFSVHTMPRTDPQLVRLYAPIMLVLLCVLTTFSGAGDRSISFTQGEVNFLFPGPFSRRELLLYKLARTLAGGLLSGFIMSIVLLHHASGWPAAFAGSFLAMLFVQLLTLAIVMLAQTVGERAYTRGRKLVLGVIVAALAVAVVPQVRQMTNAAGTAAAPAGQTAGQTAETQDLDGTPVAPPNPVEQIARALDRSPVARVVLSPVVPFVRTFTADSFGDGLLWGGASLAIVLALLLGVMRLDADYREASMAASQRVYDRLQRVRRGKLMSQFAGGKPGARRRSRLRMFPYLAGAGPTAWRQLTTALRTSRAMLWFFLLISLTIVPAFFTRGRSGSAAIILAAGIWGTMLFTSMLRFDFRSELEQMEWLKALPLGPIATAAGQLAVPVLVLTVMQTLLVSVGCYVATPQERIYLLAALPFLLPFNLMMIGVENLMFLLFPSREAGAAPGDVGLVGRNIVFFIVKILVVLLATGVAAIVGQVTLFVSGHSWVAAGGAALVVMCFFAIALVPCVGLAYKRFDPSRDTPA